MSVPCPKCQGSGLIPREADPDIHPILSKHPETCDACGGSGAQQPKNTRAANIAAAKAAES